MICTPCYFRIPYGFSFPSYSQNARVYLPHWATHLCNCIHDRGRRTPWDLAAPYLRYSATYWCGRFPCFQSWDCIKLWLLQSDSAIMWLLGEKGIRECRKERKLGSFAFSVNRLSFLCSQARTRELSELGFSAPVPTSSAFS